MKPLMRALFPALAAMSLIACSEPAQKPPASESAMKTLKVEPLTFTERTLANGLRVYAMPDANTANVSVQVWYDVGSKDDPVGRSGFAHLFEHIMFKATRNMPAETLDRLTEDVGGFNNASTWDDFTNYYQVVPANHLERILWAESERMGSLVVDKAIFESERDVVKEEYRQRILASPYGKLFGLYLAQANFTVHPYGRPGIGSIEDLDAATVEDVRAFHATYYRPDNAVLVVAGNFDQAQLDKWVDQYFGPLATPKREIPRVTAAEPARTAKDYTVYEPNTPLPAVSVSYRTPGALSPDQATLSVLDAILSKGESSRLYQSLVYTQQIATEVFTFYEQSRDPGAFSVIAILSEGKSADDGLKALNAEIAKLRDAPVTAAELDEAKNELVSETLRGRETAEGRATELANALIRFRDGRYADKLLNEIQAVSAEDVQRVAKAILDDSSRVTIRYLSDEAKPKDAKGDTIATAVSVQAQKLSIAQADIPVFTLAPEAERVRAPAPQAPVSAKLPATSEKRLANGLRVIVAPKRGVPLISAEVRVLSGSSSDPEKLGGLASLTADVLTKGTKTRSATDIARQIESLGATLSASAGADSSGASLETRADRVDEALTLMADVVRNPAFAAAEVERQRQQTLDGLQVALRQPGTVARTAISRLLFGLGPYGSVSSPTSVAAIKAEDVAGYHARHWRADNALIVISGDVSTEDGFKLAEKYFGDWKQPANPVGTEPDATMAAAEPKAVVIDLPKSGQAAVSFGMRGIARTDADYFPALVINSVLGGGYSARLNQEIRIKRGLSYGAGSSFPARQAPGPIVAIAQTRNDAAVQVVELMEQELGKLGQSEATAAEFGARQANLIGSFGRDVETASGISGQLALLATFGLPLEKLSTYVADVAAVTPAQAKAVAARLYDPKNATLVVVGDGAVFFNALKKKRASVERIPIDKVNFDSATLK
ncbi:MAG: insulinase family protein [Alphaproteobacteria bacterium]|nr:insulinase family protein [Alphaproteobacteria bacterium]